MTHITINDTSPRTQYTGDGTQTSFTYTFPIFKAEDMEVYFGSTKQTTGYTVSGAGTSTGGTVVFTTAPASGTIITLYRNLAIKRTSDFQEGGALRADVLNDELDYQVALSQQLSERLDRSLSLATTSTTGTAGLIDTVTICAENIAAIKTATNILKQADWNETDTDKLSFIKNKPSLPAAQIQSDWNEADNTALDFIKNKPSFAPIPQNTAGVGQIALVLGQAGAAIVPAGGSWICLFHSFIVVGEGSLVFPEGNVTGSVWAGGSTLTLSSSFAHYLIFYRIA